MEYQEKMSNLNDKEKIDLAAKLTIAAMSIVSFREQSTLQIQARGACDEVVTAFGEMLRFIDSGVEPPCDCHHFWHGKQ